ncbi:MAG: hypothetical protein ACTSQY_07530 [Candidatus Odinarchaeia archaeon]
MATNDDILNTLNEILKWIKFSNLKAVKESFENLLDTDDKKIAYQLSDGNTSSSYIDSIIDPHQTTIADWWRSWYNIGIAEPISVSGGKRAKKLFDLEDLGITIPSIPNNKDEEH